MTAASKEYQQQEGGGEKTTQEKGGQAMQEGGDIGTAPDQNVTESVPTVMVETNKNRLKSSSCSILENNFTTKTKRINDNHLASSPFLAPEKQHRPIKTDVSIPAPTTKDGRVSISPKVKTNSLLKKLESGASFDDPDSATTFKSEASSISLARLSSESKTPLKGHKARRKKKYSKEINQKDHASKSKKQKRMILTCTACNLGRDAEERHPVLHVPICGACKDIFKNRDKARLEKKGRINEASCVWCGLEDDKRFVLCDFCAFAFCTDCIKRNIGQAEAEELLHPDYGDWACYHCSPTLVFERLKAPEDMVFYSLDQAYASVHPPDDSRLEIQEVSDWERKRINDSDVGSIMIASIFSNKLSYLPSECGAEIASYLTAVDVGALYQINKSLREFFLKNACIIPGLFQTVLGRERKHKLFPHQTVSLRHMRMMEHQSTNFGDLRGGILADEPGLGKTATVLALICSSAGMKPQIPGISWDYQEIEDNWKNYPDKESAIARVLKLLDNKDKSYKPLKTSLQKGHDTLAAVIKRIRRIVKNYDLPGFDREQILADIAFGM